MQAKTLQDGEAIDYTPNSAVAAGQVVVQNGMVGVAIAAIKADELGALEVFGAFSIVKETGAISAGNALYWKSNGNPVNGDAGTGALTTTAAGNSFAGWAMADALSGDERVNALLVRTPSLTVGSITKPIADPGNAGAIPVTSGGYVPIVTAGSETRTLAIPTFVGQELLLFVKTDGGTAVITVASAINQAGNNTITMADVNDSIRLHAIDNNGTLAWRVVCNDGAALSTV